MKAYTIYGMIGGIGLFSAIWSPAYNIKILLTSILCLALGYIIYDGEEQR